MGQSVEMGGNSAGQDVIDLRDSLYIRDRGPGIRQFFERPMEGDPHAGGVMQDTLREVADDFQAMGTPALGGDGIVNGARDHFENVHGD